MSQCVAVRKEGCPAESGNRSQVMQDYNQCAGWRIVDRILSLGAEVRG